MNEIRETTESLLADRPELESALEELLEVDEAMDGWTFDDVDLDSGQFGELVGTELVTKDGEIYRLTDQSAIQAALADETVAASEQSDPSLVERASLPRIAVNRWTAGAILAGLGLTVLLRSLMFPDVFRPGMVVLGGNDPYSYQFWVERLLRTRPAFDLDALSNLPRDVGKKDVLYVVAMWWIAALLGGSSQVVRIVLAIYPLLSGIVFALVAYWLGTTLTQDRRVGVTSMLFLAVTPVHAYRVSLGFADHHPFDYIWMAMTVTGLVGLAIEERYRSDTVHEAIRSRLTSPRTAWFACLIAVGVAGNLLAWRGGPLYLVPIGLYVVGRSLSQLRTETSPLLASIPLLSGLGLGGVLTLIPHLLFGWLPPYRAFTPALLAAGSLAVVVAIELAARRDYTARNVALGVGILSTGGIIGSILFVPWVGTIAQRGLRLLADKGIAENAGLFAANLGAIFAPVLLFSFILFVALPAAAVATRQAYRSYRPGLLALVVYFWTFLLLTVVRIRFGGQLSLFSAVFAGYAFFWLADWLDITVASTFRDGASTSTSALTIPDGRTMFSFAVLFLLVSGFAAVQIPVKQSQIAIDDSQYETAQWMDRYAEQHGWEYPHNYVFSQWGRNRFFNNLVHGRSPNYRFAKLNYPDFLTSRSPELWYERLRDRVGFVVTERGVDLGNGSMYDRLHRHRTSRQNGVPGLEHYRYVHQEGDGEYRVYTLVPGATVTGVGEPNTTVTVSANVSVGEETFTYERRARTTMTGHYAVTVPYPGTYRNVEPARVTESDVAEGRFVVNGSDAGNWSFEAGRGEYVFDTAGNNHGFIENGSWVSGQTGRGLAFDGDGDVTVPDPPSLDESGFTYSLWFRTAPDVSYTGEQTGPRLLAQTTETVYRETNGLQVLLLTGNITATVGNGTQAGIARGPRVDDGEWHHVTVSWDGQRVELTLDGQLVGTGTFRGDPGGDAPLVFGASSAHSHGFTGRIDAIRYRNGSDLPDRREQSDPTHPSIGSVTGPTP